MVMMPLHDDNTLRFIPFQWATAILIALNVLAFLFQLSLGEEGVQAAAEMAGMVPSTLFGAAPSAGVPAAVVTPEATLLTYMFLHGDWLHLAGNMLFLWVFGDNVEDALGSITFTAFYLACGVAAGLAHAYVHADSGVPLIGASGATAGVIGAYLVLYPRVWMWVIVLMRLPIKLPAIVVIGAWLATQILFIYAEVNDDTAWWAHIGGFVAGVILVFFLRRRGTTLFGGNTPKA